MQESYTEKRKSLSEALGRVILNLRQNSNLSVRAVAYSIEISKSTLLLAESGKLDPQLSTFCRIAEAFNIKPSNFLKLVEKELPKNWTFSE